jgi:acyl-CoA synthetase (NDP forming)
MDATLITRIISPALAEGRDALTDLEGLSLLAALGVEAPRYVFVSGSGDAERMLGASDSFFPGERAVVKVISPEILHKTDVGGVAIVPNDRASILAAMAEMEGRFTRQRVDGYTVNEFVAYDPRIGREMIVGYRFAKDFGPIVSFGPGGIYAEYLASSLKEGVGSLFLSPETATRELVARELSRNAVRTLAAGGLRNTKPAISDGAIVDVVMAFLDASRALAAAGVSEFEVNPFVVAKRPGGDGSRLVALDVLAKLAPAASGDLAIDGRGRVVNSFQAVRPTDKIGKLLMPASAAVVGVSEKGMNNGRIILRNLIENGFDRSRLYVVKPGAMKIEDCACYADFSSLPEPVDLAVLAVPAASAAETIADIADGKAAESVIVTTGGLEEKAGTEGIVSRMLASIAASRKAPGRGPLINGGNCLGVRSVPGRYNTLFIPEYKLPMPKGKVEPIAVVSQSGAFAVSRISKHQNVNPKYMITCGNQMDLTVGDYLEWLAKDEEIEIFAAYVEGFKPLDGEKALRAARAIVESGRVLILYRAGRTAAGAQASASHTASIAGDYAVTKSLFRQVGAVVADSLEEFDDALTTFALLRGKRAAGDRLGALSNAGFECVAIADNLGALQLAPFSAATGPRLEAVFEQARIGEIVDVHNPIDLTPGAGDDAYDETFRAVLDDPNVDCGIVGIVPLTPRMNTLAAGPDSNGEDVTRPDSLAVRYGELMAHGVKPWVAVVDAGALYSPLAAELEARGVPTFRTADRALKMLNIWIKASSPRRTSDRKG